MDRIKLGYAPTRRSIFSAPDARKYRDLTAERLRELEIDFVDITDINKRACFMMTQTVFALLKNSNQKKLTVYSFLTAILAPSTNAPDWLKILTFRYCFGDL